MQTAAPYIDRDLPASDVSALMTLIASEAVGSQTLLTLFPNGASVVTARLGRPAPARFLRGMLLHFSKLDGDWRVTSRASYQA